MPGPEPTHHLKLIDLRNALSDTPARFIPARLLYAVEGLLAVNRVNTIHRSLPAGISAEDFCRRSLETLEIDYALTEQELARIPACGPLVMVANHPYGGIEGIILAEVLLYVRSDVRILGNYLLTRLPGLAGHHARNRQAERGQFPGCGRRYGIESGYG